MYFKGTVCQSKNSREYIQTSVITHQNIFPTRCLRMLTFSLMGIDAHLEKSIEGGTLDVDQLWLANYLKAKPAGDGEAEITAFFRIARRTEILNKQFIDSNMHQYRLDSGGRATHLVQQVVYGAEFIVLLKTTFDSNTETPKSAIQRLTIVSREFFDNAVKSNWTAIDPPAQLGNISCSIVSNLQDGPAEHVKLRQVAECLRDATRSIEDAKWRPVEIVLVHIPSQLETRLQTEKLKKKKRDLLLTLNWILTKSKALANHSFLNKIPPFKIIIDHFVVLLNSFFVKTEQFFSLHIASYTPPDVVLKEQESINDLLTNAVNWFVQLSKEVQCLYPILKGIQLPMVHVDMADIKARPFPENVDQIKVFLLKVEYKGDQLMQSLHKFIDNSSCVCQHPFFLIASCDTQRLKDVGTKLSEFANEAESKPSSCFFIGLVKPDSPSDEGSVEVFLPPSY